MGMLTPEQVQQLKEAVKVICSQVEVQAKKNDSQDIPEFLASEIIDLVEWCSPNKDLQKPLASAVLKEKKWPLGVEGAVKKYFSLAY